MAELERDLPSPFTRSAQEARLTGRSKFRTQKPRGPAQLAEIPLPHPIAVRMPHYAHTANLPDGTRDPNKTLWQPLDVPLDTLTL
jgi:hypothetical protein